MLSRVRRRPTRAERAYWRRLRHRYYCRRWRARKRDAAKRAAAELESKGMAGIGSRCGRCGGLILPDDMECPACGRRLPPDPDSGAP